MYHVSSEVPELGSMESPPFFLGSSSSDSNLDDAGDFECGEQQPSSTRGPGTPTEIPTCMRGGKCEEKEFMANPSKGAPLWGYYKLYKCGQHVKCIECGRRISFIKHSTSAMKNHRKLHEGVAARSRRRSRMDELSERLATAQIGRVNEQLAFTPEQLKDWMLASLLSRTNLTANCFSDEVVRLLFRMSSLGSVDRNVAAATTTRECARVRQLLSNELTDLRNSGAIFSLTADEWTYRSRKFLGVTLHSSKIIPSLKSNYIELLDRLEENPNAENIFAALAAALLMLGLNTKDIRSLTTDGASVMRRVGKLFSEKVSPMPFYHHLFYAHAVHLAVLETLKNSSAEEFDPQLEGRFRVSARDDTERNLSDDTEESSTDGESIFEDCSDSASGTSEGTTAQSGMQWLSLVNTVRKICKEFKIKVNRAANLAHHTALTVQLDTPIRWNSVLAMLERFLELEGDLRTIYRDGGLDFPLADGHVAACRFLVNILKYAETTILALSKDSINLLDADCILEKLLNDLEAQPSSFARLLRTNISRRIIQRRGIASRCLRFIYASVGCENHNQRLDNRFQSSPEFSDTLRQASQSLTPGNATLEGEIRKYCFLWLKVPMDVPEDSEEAKAAAAYSDGLIRLHRACGGEGTASAFPTQLVENMKSVIPTSVPSERLFSKARHSRRYSQGRLSDRRFCEMMFLKHFYNNNKPWTALIQ